MDQEKFWGVVVPIINPCTPEDGVDEDALMRFYARLAQAPVQGLYINGGTINITAQSPFDYDGQGQLNGGTVTVNGSKVTELTNQMMGGGMGGGRGGMTGDPNMNGNGAMGGGPMGGGFTR